MKKLEEIVCIFEEICKETGASFEIVLSTAIKEGIFK